MRWRGISHETTPDSYLPLAVQLQQIKDNTERYLTRETLDIHDRAIEELRRQGVAQKALKPGDRAPHFALPDQGGALVHAHDLYQPNGLVVVFFRGRWCPYCVTQLESLQFLWPQLRERGLQLVAISPQKQHQNFLTADQHKLRFPLLSDARNEVARAFGVCYTVPEEQCALYRRVFVNLAHINQDAPDSLPLPATFVITSTGEVARATVNEDFHFRPEPADLLR